MIRILRRRGQKSLRLTVSPLGRVTLSAPRWVPARMLQAFLKKQSDWIAERVKNLPLRATPITFSKADRVRAKSFIEDRLAHFNRHYQFAYQGLRIKNLATRWGSCSSRGNLNFHVGIIHLPPDLADYLVVHELCHLKEMNHGPRFWQLIAETIVDPKAKRRQLKARSPQTIPPIDAQP